MRRALVDAERARQAAKRGRGVKSVSFEAAEIATPAPVDVAGLKLFAELATIRDRADRSSCDS